MISQEETKGTKVGPIRAIVAAIMNFRLRLARRRNARLAIGKLELQTQLLNSPLAGYSVNDLKKLARRRPVLADGCRAEIKRRLYVGKHRDEIFVTKRKNTLGSKSLVTSAATAILVFSFQVAAPLAYGAEEKQSAVIPNVLWTTTGQWVLGFIGVLVIGYYAIGCISGVKKLFAKKPPIHEELTNIHKKIYAVKAGLTEAHDALRDDMDERFRELAIDRQRSLGELNEKISSIAEDTAFIKGKMSA